MLMATLAGSTGKLSATIPAQQHAFQEQHLNFNFTPRMLAKIRLQLGPAPQHLWLDLCRRGSSVGVHSSLRAHATRCRCGANKGVVTKYFRPTLCQCQFSAILQQKSGKMGRRYYVCPVCNNHSDRKLKKVLDHAWLRHSFMPGCERDFQLWTASRDMNAPPRGEPREVSEGLRQAWVAQWVADDMAGVIRRRVLRSIRLQLRN